MSGKLNHLAITTDHYALIGMFYRAVFGMKVSGDTSREMSAISVGDGYVGMTHHSAPRRPQGRARPFRHRGRETSTRCARRWPRNIPTSRSSSAPATGRLQATAPTTRLATISICPSRDTRTAPRSMPRANGSRTTPSAISRLRARHAGKMAEFYVDMFDLEARNVPWRARQLPSHRRPRDHDDPAVDDFGLQRRRHRAAGDGSHRLPGAEHRGLQEESRRSRQAEPPARVRSRSISIPRASRG